jgi:hypothetical protein
VARIFAQIFRTEAIDEQNCGFLDGRKTQWIILSLQGEKTTRQDIGKPHRGNR